MGNMDGIWGGYEWCRFVPKRGLINIIIGFKCLANKLAISYFGKKLVYHFSIMPWGGSSLFE